jgi:Asp-tRNA(Asn)/Glu-tRNA(Gln) amidotransferase A subunit family amidase
MSPLVSPTDLRIAEAAAAIQAGDLTALGLVNSCLERIDQLDDQIQAWAIVDRERALAAARNLDEELQEGKSRGLLHGIPVGIKDIFYTEGLRTEAGSKMCSGFVPSFDAASVKRLKDAGAIILGKTHTTEFALFDPAPTRNPWNTSHTPGGSSSGSGAAVAAGMCLASLGSQTLGSVLRPASYNGIVGFKPHYGRISTHGVVPLSWTFDHVGIFSRSVEDSAILFQSMAGYDSKDLNSLDKSIPDCLSQLKTARPPRIGIVKQYFYAQADDEMRAQTDRCADIFRQAGASVEELLLPDSFADIFENGLVIMKVEAAVSHKKMFVEQREQFSPKIKEFIEEGLSFEATAYAEAHQKRKQQMADMEPLYHEFDAFLTPGAPGAAPKGLAYTGSPIMQGPWTILGVPTINLPAGLDKNRLPLGIQLTAPPRAEALLLSTALWCENALKVELHPPLD